MFRLNGIRAGVSGFINVSIVSSLLMRTYTFRPVFSEVNLKSSFALKSLTAKAFMVVLR